jgi:hypothetical protein
MFMTKIHINKFAYISQHMSNTDSADTTSTASTIKFPEKFPEIISDFTTDLTTTFPEYAHLWAKWTNLRSASTDAEVLETQHLFEYCLLLYPERFFDILYQTEDIFSKDSTANVFFLPDVDFRQLYHCENVSESIRKTLWKYLQLLLITIMSNVNNKSCFGDSANLFDGIDEGELQTKLTETISGLSSFFKDILPQGGEGASADPTGLFGGVGGGDTEGASDSDDDEAPDLVDGECPKPSKPASGGGGKKSKGLFDNLPDPADLHEKLKGMFDGKIGNLAKELAEELTDDFMGILDEDDQADMKTAKNTGDVLKKLMKNPGKIMELMKTVGNKLKNKMNSGDISQEEIMKEASEMIGKMKDLGGEGTDMNDILKNLMKNMGGMGGMGGGGKTKFNTAAMGQMSKRQAQVEKMRQRMLAKQQAATAATAAAAAAGSPTGNLGNAAGGAHATPAEPLPSGYLDANVKFVLEPADNGSGNLSFRLPDEGVQEKTKINPVGQSAVATATTPPIDDSWLDDTPVGQSSGGGGGKKGGGKSKKSKGKK